MEKFNLQLALTGFKLITRNGIKATNFAPQSLSGEYPFKCEVNGIMRGYNSDGKFSDSVKKTPT